MLSFAKKVCFFVFAILLFSCEEKYVIENPVETVIISADSSVKIVGNTITFSALTNTGTNVSANTTFEVDGSIISSNAFSSATTGVYAVRGRFAGKWSESISITFHDGSETNFAKRVLVEDYTGTWCGYCPRVAFALEQALAQPNNKVVAVAIHRASSNPISSSFDPYNFDSSAIENILDDPGYPKGYLNRMTKWNTPEDQNIQQVINLSQGANPKLGIALTSGLSNNNISLEVKVKFAKNFTGLKLVVYILENKLIYNQKNYTAFYGGVSVIPNFEHNHVLRGLMTNLLGDAIADSETTIGKTFSRNFNISVPSNILSKENLEYVAFVVDANGTALNSRAAKKTDVQAFEEL